MQTSWSACMLMYKRVGQKVGRLQKPSANPATSGPMIAKIALVILACCIYLNSSRMSNTFKRVKRTRASAFLDTATSQAPWSAGPSIVDLPEELLQRILCRLELSLDQWFELALVCRHWKKTMQKLVPANFVLAKRSHLHHMERCSVKVGSITVKQGSASALRTALERLLASEKFDSRQLTSMCIKADQFFMTKHSFSNWLPGLVHLRRLELVVYLNTLEKLLHAVPDSLQDLDVSIHCHSHLMDAATTTLLKGFSKLIHLQALSIKAVPGFKPNGNTLMEHREKLAHLIHAGDTLQEAVAKPCSATGAKASPIKKQLYKRALRGDHAKDLSSGGACGQSCRGGASDVVEDGGSGKAKAEEAPSPPPACCTPRAARIAQLMQDAYQHADLAKQRSGEQESVGQTDCLHSLLHILQWQLALAIVLDADQPGSKSQTQMLQGLWQSADIGEYWIDLRPLSKLTSCTIKGLPHVWLPASVQTLSVASYGYTGPLPAGLVKYQGNLRASNSMTHWELRPLGLLPLTELDINVSCSEDRLSREFCFQGTHSLQLHSKLQRLCLVTDRGLHVDAQISHRLLSLLAQNQQLRQVDIGSGSYRLQGDPVQGKGVAALNLLSDLKDHCGWEVEQQICKSNIFGHMLQLTTCRPPAAGNWPFQLPDEAPDFVSDFE